MAGRARRADSPAPGPPSLPHTPHSSHAPHTHLDDAERVRPDERAAQQVAQHRVPSRDLANHERHAHDRHRQ
eukprot:362451-Chlamydomonas_euryale.AAC.2